MHSSLAASCIAAISLIQLSAALPNPGVVASSTRTDQPRIPLKNDRDETGNLVTVPQMVVVQTSTSIYDKTAFSITAKSTCQEMCDDAGPDAQADCMGGTYNWRTELCVLFINSVKIEDAPATKECPRGKLPKCKQYETAELFEWQRDEDKEHDDYCDVHDCSQSAIEPNCSWNVNRGFYSAKVGEVQPKVKCEDSD